MNYEFGNWDEFGNWSKDIYLPNRDSFVIYSSSINPDFLVIAKSFGLISLRFRVSPYGEIDFMGGYYRIKDLKSSKTTNLNLNFDTALSLDKHIVSRYLLANLSLTDLRLKEKGVKIIPYTISFKHSSISEHRVFAPSRLDIDFLRCESDIMCCCPFLHLQDVTPDNKKRMLDLYTFVVNNIEIKDSNGVSIPLNII